MKKPAVLAVLAVIVGCEAPGFDPSACGGSGSPGTYAVLNGSPRLSTADYDYVARGLACQGWSGTSIAEASAEDLVLALWSQVDLVYYSGHGLPGRVEAGGTMLDLDAVEIRARVVILSACKVMTSTGWIKAAPGTIVMGYSGRVEVSDAAEVAMEMLRQMREGYGASEAFAVANYAAGMRAVFFEQR